MSIRSRARLIQSFVTVYPLPPRRSKQLSRSWSAAEASKISVTYFMDGPKGDASNRDSDNAYLRRYRLSDSVYCFIFFGSKFSHAACTPLHTSACTHACTPHKSRAHTHLYTLHTGARTCQVSTQAPVHLTWEQVRAQTSCILYVDKCVHERLYTLHGNVGSNACTPYTYKHWSLYICILPPSSVFPSTPSPGLERAPQPAQSLCLTVACARKASEQLGVIYNSSEVSIFCFRPSQVGDH